MTAFPERDLPEAWTAWPVLEKPTVRSDLLRAVEGVVELRPGITSDRD